MLTAARYRSAQAVIMAALAALVTACAVFAPLYNRALQQATVTSALTGPPAQVTGLSLTSFSPVVRSSVRTPEQLVAFVPADLARHYAAPVRSQSVVVRQMPLTNEPDGSLEWREGQCSHVRLTAGRCPAAAGEVAVSAGQLAATPSWRVGTTLAMGEYDDAVTQVPLAPKVTVTVVGVYIQPASDPFWFGSALTGRTESGDLDAMLTDRSTFSAPVGGPSRQSAPWEEIHNGADFALRTRGIGIDQVIPLAAAVDTFRRVPWAPTARSTSELNAAVPAYAASGLPEIGGEIAAGRDQANVTVPLLMAQLALLLACVLWLVMVAATDQRRAEVAVARLRGRGSVGARRLLLGETLPAVLVGVPLGVVAAFLLSWGARHLVLPTDPPFEVPRGVLPAVAAAAAGMSGLALLSVRRVSREPVATLLRSVASRQGGFTLGVLEAMLVAASVTSFLALATGSVKGPVGLAAPTLLAVAAGVVGGRLVPLALGIAGRALLRRGRLATGSGILQAGRRGTTRWLVPVVTVAMCLVVFAANAVAVSRRNLEGRAEAEVGARTVLTLSSTDAKLVAGAVIAFDPHGRHVTPVVRVVPPNGAVDGTFGVVPDQFRRLAQWPGVDVATLPWSSLTAPAVKPLMVKGTRLTYTMLSGGLSMQEDEDADSDQAPPPPAVITLGLQVVQSDGSTRVQDIGTVAPTPGPAVTTAAVDCAEGCAVIGIVLSAPVTAPSTGGTVTISGMAVDGVPLVIGQVSQWASSTRPDSAVRAADAPEGGLQIGFSNGGRTQVTLARASVPVTAPAFVSDRGGSAAGSGQLSGSLVDGSTIPVTVAGRIPFVPGGPPAANVLNLDNMLSQGWRGQGSAVITVYADTEDPAYLSSLTKALAAKGIGIVRTQHPSELARAYRSTAAAWSLLLALVVGGTALAVAALALVVLVATSWRARSRDYASLRMAGLVKGSVAQMAVVETVPVVLVSSLIGAVCGLVGARAAMPMVPLFPSSPPTFPIDLRVAWAVAGVVVVLGTLVLCAVGVGSGRWVARRSTFDRLRETA